jgi:hypothetical protein
MKLNTLVIATVFALTGATVFADPAAEKTGEAQKPAEMQQKATDVQQKTETKSEKTDAKKPNAKHAKKAKTSKKTDDATKAN